jgi:anti-sigma-K factor RskA
LEAYVLGALPEADATNVARALVQYPEVAAIEEALLKLGQATAITPPAHLQDQIWQAVSGQHAAVATDGVSSRDGGAQLVDFKPQQQKAWSFNIARAAVWAALIGSMLLNLFLWNGRRQEHKNSLAIRQKLDTAMEGQRALALALAKYEHEVNMMANPDMQPVVMKTMQKGHPMVAVIYYNKDGTDAYVSLQRLPKPPHGMQYQLWAMADGKPIDLGMIKNDMVQAQGIEKVEKAIPAGQAFAISLEKEGGSPSPTMDKIYVMGKVASKVAS